MESDSPERWATLTELLGAALERPANERGVYLDQACAKDPTLREEVELLLEAYERSQATERFSRGALDLIPMAFPEAPPASSVGPYRLLKEVGRGGMGSVWLAERADGVYEQRVAVKIMRAGFLPESYHRRFRSERQILAHLQHPHIGRLLDGGLSDQGHPFLVMEYVEGQPITTYCNERKLDLDERLDLFVRVCDAVAYAHQNLVVHRDIKPSNVLVTAEGDVKLLDFGIAKLIDAEPSEGSDELPLTNPGMAAMTPEYASPEQVSGGTITTATDVYALGIVLFELLTGERPYAFDLRTPSAIEQVICQTEPARPSTVARGSGDVVSTHATPERRARRLRGDLDTIVLKALRKEPERRYPAAAQLAEDLRRHQAGLTVHARPDTTAYRVRKFVGRHRVAVSAAVVVVFALVGGLVVSLAQVRIATVERQKADAVNAFLLDMLASPDPYADGPDVRVVDVLDRAEETMPERLADRPELEAAVRQTLGTSFLELGLYDRAGPHLERAALLHDQNRAEDDLTRTHATLGRLRLRQGDYAGADSFFTLALEADRRRFGDGHPRLAERLGSLGSLRWEQGEYEAAEPLLLESLRILEEQASGDSLSVAYALGQLATLRADQGRLEESEQLYRRSLTLYRAAHGDDHPEVPQTLSHIGIIRDDLEDWDEARRLHLEAVALYKRLRGDEHPDVAYAMGNLASVEINLGNFARAESLQQEAIRINIARLGADHPNIGILYNNMASLYRRQGEPERALDAYRQAVAIWRAGLPPDHPYLAYGLQNVGAVLFARERAREAVPFLEEAYRIRTGLLPDDHPERAVTASWYGAALAEVGDLARAESLLVASVAVLTDALGAEHTMTIGASERLEAFKQRSPR